MEKSVRFKDLVAWKKDATASDQHQLYLFLVGCLGNGKLQSWGRKGLPKGVQNTAVG